MNGSFVLRIINYCPRGVNASNLMIAPNPAGNIRTCGRGHIKVLPNLLLFELRFYIRYCCSRVTKSTTVHTIPSQLTGWMAAASLLHQIGPPARSSAQFSSARFNSPHRCRASAHRTSRCIFLPFDRPAGRSVVRSPSVFSHPCIVSARALLHCITSSHKTAPTKQREENSTPWKNEHHAVLCHP